MKYVIRIVKDNETAPKKVIEGEFEEVQKFLESPEYQGDPHIVGIYIQKVEG